MKMKNFFVVFLSVLSAAALLAGCTAPGLSEAGSQKAPPETYEGVVSGGYDDGVLTLTAETGESRSFYISQDTEITGADSAAPGDRVTLTCENQPGAEYPSVLTIEVTEAKKEPVRMVMIEGALYTDTGRTNDLARCGVMDGEITAAVAPDETPTQNNQSNFGTGYGYQFAPENGVDVCIDGIWVEFEKETLS